MKNQSPEFNCSIYYTLTVLGGKWKWIILYSLSRNGVMRYSELKDTLPSIAHKTLSQQLKELNSSGLIHREQYPQIPPKVEYALTEKGKSLIPILKLMCEWGDANRSS